MSAVGDPARGGRHPLPSLQAWCATLGRFGISPQSVVRIFDDAGGGLFAARAWWMLRAVGHENVQVIAQEEVVEAWVSARSEARPCADYPASQWTLPTLSIDEVKLRAQDPEWRLLDARAAARFRGDVEHLDPVAGHIPGALSMPWQQHRDLDLARESFASLLGETPSTRSIVSCGSGVTACFLALQMHRLELGMPTLYVGSWSEWCRQP